MNLELHQIELRYERLRRRSAFKERQLLASLSDNGQLLPVVVVGSADGRYVLLDGYKRVRALRGLKQDTVAATAWDLGELEALMLERLMRTSEANNAIEQGWLMEELNERFGLCPQELGRRFDKSESWVSRRLALVRALPEEVRQRVQSGEIGAHSAMKYLVPLARANRAECVRLVTAVCTLRPSTRQLGALYVAWMAGNPKTRELLVTQPGIFLRAEMQAREQLLEQKPDGKRLLDDLRILVGTSRRARHALDQGVLVKLLPAEMRLARRVFGQARSECNALLGSADTLLGRDGIECEGEQTSDGAVAIPQPESSLLEHRHA
jgi:ParB/RepB/Spo0J family partition protein